MWYNYSFLTEAWVLYFLHLKSSACVEILSVLGWAGKVLKTAIFAPYYLLFDLNARLTEETKRKKEEAI